MLFESSPEANRLRVQADNLDQPFDANEGVKLELGSTAKLRTAAHYLEVVTELHEELSGLSAGALRERARVSREPITRWAVQTLSARPDLPLEDFLKASLDRTYSASPYEAFFTGGGIHTFANFDPSDNFSRVTVRDALRRSVNLVFIRLMRDLVLFHEARLPYDARAVLDDPVSPERQRLLDAVADEEARRSLERAFEAYRGKTAGAIAERLLGRRSRSARDLTLLLLGWRAGAVEERDLANWLAQRLGPIPSQEIGRLLGAYRNPSFTLADYAYLLRVPLLDLWASGELELRPSLSWNEFLARSAGARRVTRQWLFEPRSRRAQNLRLKIRMERDAFARMSESWRHLGFPFERLVPSYATAIGSSGDRPAALAELMGIIVNDGVRLPTFRLEKLSFAEGTPYQTVLEPDASSGERVMHPAMARILRVVLAEVVSSGTARRAEGAFQRPDGMPVPVGGKTGSGDNRFSTFARGGRLLSRRAINRTATFVFYIGDRYFGVVTAFVPGRESERYSFTSALPVSVLRLLSPAINIRLAAGRAPAPPPGRGGTLSTAERVSFPAVAADASRKVQS